MQAAKHVGDAYDGIERGQRAEVYAAGVPIGDAEHGIHKLRRSGRQRRQDERFGEDKRGLQRPHESQQEKASDSEPTGRLHRRA